VRLAGALEHRRLRDLLEHADVLAMPCVVASDGDRDSMPVVVKEALSLEIPVVATDEVGLPELVREPWGRLVPPHDPDAIAEALAEVLSLPAHDRIEMGRAGRAHVLEHCNVDREAAKLASLLSLTARASGSARKP
jgi:glycosyltransferase involved in cell wall biosynthesis